MRLRHLYLGLCVLGVVVPYAQFVPWLSQHGLQINLFERELGPSSGSMLSSPPSHSLCLFVRSAQRLPFVTSGSRLWQLSLSASLWDYRYFFTYGSAPLTRPPSSKRRSQLLAVVGKSSELRNHYGREVVESKQSLSSIAMGWIPLVKRIGINSAAGDVCAAGHSWRALCAERSFLA